MQQMLHYSYMYKVILRSKIFQTAVNFQMEGVSGPLLKSHLMMSDKIICC